MRLLVFWSIAAAVAATPALAQHGGDLAGTVLDPQGLPMGKSTIALRWNYIDTSMVINGVSSKKPEQPHRKQIALQTDGAGRFHVQLAAGNWDIFAYRDGVAPTCAVVTIEPDKTTTIELRFPKWTFASVQ